MISRHARKQDGSPRSSPREHPCCCANLYSHREVSLHEYFLWEINLPCDMWVFCAHESFVHASREERHTRMHKIRRSARVIESTNKCTRCPGAIVSRSFLAINSRLPKSPLCIQIILFKKRKKRSSISNYFYNAMNNLYNIIAFY